MDVSSSIEKKFADSLFDKEKVLSWRELCFVRAVENPIREFKNEKDNLVSQTPIDSSKGNIPRITSHWTINHFVESHLGGSWEDCGAVIVCPGEETIKVNGSPENINIVDTFWAHNITIPNNSIILWINDPPANIKIPEAIKQIRVDYPFDKKRLISNILHRIDNKKYGSVEEYKKLLHELGRLKGDLQKLVSDSVNEQIIKMGCHVLDPYNCNDHHHIPAIDNLAKRENIKYTGLHVDSPMGSLELGEGVGYLNPLLELSTLSDEELFEHEEGSQSKFAHLLNRFRETLSSFKEPLSSGEKKQLNILSAEIYNKLINVDGALDSVGNQIALGDLCEKSSFIKNNLLKWVKKDMNENANKIKVVLSGHLIF